VQGNTPFRRYREEAGAMRLLHISNWNSGRVLYREPHAADYDAMLREIADIAPDARPDLILHTGEGFGSLDTTILAEALEALEAVYPLAVSSLSSANLHAVAADLDHVLPVTRNPLAATCGGACTRT
jgi:hypothetical protein